MVSQAIPALFSVVSGVSSARTAKKEAKKQAKQQSAAQDVIARGQDQQQRTLKDQENEIKKRRQEQIKALKGRSGSRSLIKTSETGLPDTIG